MYPFPIEKKAEVDKLIHHMGYCAERMMISVEQNDFEKANVFKRDMELFYRELETISKKKQEEETLKRLIEKVNFNQVERILNQ